MFFFISGKLINVGFYGGIRWHDSIVLFGCFVVYQTFWDRQSDVLYTQKRAANLAARS